MYVYHTHADVKGGQKRVLGPLGTSSSHCELFDVGVGN